MDMRQHQEMAEQSSFDQLALWIAETLRRHELAEVGCGVFAFFYGISLLVPPAAFASSPSFDRIDAITNETVVGLLFWFTGMMILLSSFLDWSPGRVGATLWLFVMLVFYALMLGLANPAGRAWVTYGCLAGLAFLVFWRNCSRAFPTWIRRWRSWRDRIHA